MSASTFKELNAHYGHDIEVARYGNKEGIWNVAIECLDCHEVLVDFDNDDEEAEE